ncbi:RloB family protein [Ruegeria halocynthiae]|uniref:RloB family protein n=1 Tax=Ruegeria halocynthiae TaxID=985054 RepID=UPI00055A5EE2|nr:RloB family protein [Ruegeria halocynthiae]
MVKRGRRRAKGKEDFARGRAKRQERDKVLIVTEGEKTEPDYFRRLISELGLTTAKVRITGEGGSAPISVVEMAEGILEHDDDYEQIYMVFDRDRHASYDDAIAKTAILKGRSGFDDKTVVAVTSVPCFEIWYSLHVSESCKPYCSTSTGGSPAKSLISDLKRAKLNGVALFSEYEKSGCKKQFFEIAPQREVAKQRAERILQRARQAGDKEHHENPSTRVHFIVGALEKLSKS